MAGADHDLRILELPGLHEQQVVPSRAPGGAMDAVISQQVSSPVS